MAWAEPAAVALRRAMWEHFRPFFPSETAEAEARLGGFEGVDAHVGRNIQVTVVVFDDDGAPLGCGSLRPVPRLGTSVAEIKKVFVAASARGRGVGRVVVAELELRAVERGWDRLVLETDVQNEAAIALYSALGYEITEALRSDGPISMARSLRDAREHA